jgi:hypothetical protein
VRRTVLALAVSLPAVLGGLCTANDRRTEGDSSLSTERACRATVARRAVGKGMSITLEKRLLSVWASLQSCGMGREAYKEHGKSGSTAMIAAVLSSLAIYCFVGCEVSGGATKVFGFKSSENAPPRIYFLSGSQ